MRAYRLPLSTSSTVKISKIYLIISDKNAFYRYYPECTIESAVNVQIAKKKEKKKSRTDTVLQSSRVYNHPGVTDPTSEVGKAQIAHL